MDILLSESHVIYSFIIREEQILIFLFVIKKRKYKKDCITNSISIGYILNKTKIFTNYKSEHY